MTRFQALARASTHGIVVALTLAISLATAQAGSISPPDFGPDHDVVDFDALAAGSEITTQLRLVGIASSTVPGTVVKIVDGSELDGALPHSGSQAARVSKAGAPIRFEFQTPKQRVGAYVGHLFRSTIVVLRAYDGDGAEIDGVELALPKGTAEDFVSFVGLEVAAPLIAAVVFEAADPFAELGVDDLIVEPSQESGVSAVDIAEYAATLSSQAATQDQKLDAISALARQPSQAASQALQQAAVTGADLYLRERAIQGLVQIRDPGAIAPIAAIGVAPPSPVVRMAAYSAVAQLRRHFPLPDPPAVTMTLTGATEPGVEFEVEARVVSAVERSEVDAQLGGVRGLEFSKTPTAPARYSGPLAAGQEVVLRARYTGETEGVVRIPLRFRATDDPVDSLEHETVLHVRIGTDGGETSSTPFADPEAQDVHVLTEE